MLFRSLRPRPEHAAAVAAPPYDVLSSEEARVRADGKPYSFLHISKAEIDLPEEIDHYAPEVYAKSAENLQKLIDQRNRVLDEARYEGRKAADEISAEARASAEELLDRARRDVARERDKTLAELRAQVASLVVSGTEKLLRREVGPDDQAAFVDEFAKELEQDEDQRSG